ncbi:MAG: hypothetical protein AAF572_16215 [Cyanobacteria bacterium P01_B01_bin.77]
MPELLVMYYEALLARTDFFDMVTLAEAQQIVEQARQREWDDLE